MVNENSRLYSTLGLISYVGDVPAIPTLLTFPARIFGCQSWCNCHMLARINIIYICRMHLTKKSERLQTINVLIPLKS